MNDIWHKALGIKHRRRCLKWLGASLGLAAVLWPPPVWASAPALKVSPLKYQEIIPADTPKLGFIDVSNPSDVTIRVVSEVQAFRQLNLEGDLEYFPDQRLADGIKLASTDFELGSREAARIGFTIDPLKLGKGGAFGAVFFRTVPPASQAGDGSTITTSVRVGTLLVLNVGNEIKAEGKMRKLSLPWLQIGPGLAGTLEYANTASLAGAVAFNPALDIKAGPWGRASRVEGPLVLPGNTRRMEFAKPGSYLGILPVSITDNVTGQKHRAWVLAVTGYWPRVLVIGLFMAMGLGWRYWRRKRRLD